MIAELLSWADVNIIVRGAFEIDLPIAKLANRSGKKLVYIWKKPNEIDGSFDIWVVWYRIRRFLDRCCGYAKRN